MTAVSVFHSSDKKGKEAYWKNNYSTTIKIKLEIWIVSSGSFPAVCSTLYIRNNTLLLFLFQT